MFSDAHLLYPNFLRTKPRDSNFSISGIENLQVFLDQHQARDFVYSDPYLKDEDLTEECINCPDNCKFENEEQLMAHWENNIDCALRQF